MTHTANSHRVDVLWTDTDYLDVPSERCTSTSSTLDAPEWTKVFSNVVNHEWRKVESVSVADAWGANAFQPVVGAMLDADGWS